MRQKTIGILFILAAAVMFGINGSLSRLLFDNGVTPVTLVEFRMIIGGLCLFGFLSIRQRQSLKLPRRVLGWMMALGLTFALVTYTYFVSISRIPIAITLVNAMCKFLLPKKRFMTYPQSSEQNASEEDLHEPGRLHYHMFLLD